MKTVIDIADRIEALALANIDPISYTPTKDEQLLLTDIFRSAIDHIDKLDDEAFLLDPAEAAAAEAMIASATALGPDNIHKLIGGLVSSIKPAETQSTTTEDDATGCATAATFWGFTLCITLPSCTLGKAGCTTTHLIFGICKPSGNVCVCREGVLLLSVLLVLLSVGLFFFGGAIIGGIGRELLRRVAVRAAAAGA